MRHTLNYHWCVPTSKFKDWWNSETILKNGAIPRCLFLGEQSIKKTMMNQKNVFTAIAAVVILQSIAYFFMSDTLAANAYPTLDQAGQKGISNMMQIFGVLGIGIGLFYYAARNIPSVLWALCLGSGLLMFNTLKHKFIDQLNVPISAIFVQVAIFLVVAYLWMQKNRSTAVS